MLIASNLAEIVLPFVSQSPLPASANSALEIVGLLAEGVGPDVSSSPHEATVPSNTTRGTATAIVPGHSLSVGLGHPGRFAALRHIYLHVASPWTLDRWVVPCGRERGAADRLAFRRLIREH